MLHLPSFKPSETVCIVNTVRLALYRLRVDVEPVDRREPSVVSDLVVAVLRVGAAEALRGVDVQYARREVLEVRTEPDRHHKLEPVPNVNVTDQ